MNNTGRFWPPCVAFFERGVPAGTVIDNNAGVHTGLDTGEVASRFKRSSVIVDQSNCPKRVRKLEIIMKNAVRDILFSATVACALGGVAIPTMQVAQAGEGFFEKIGDGWRKGKWVPGVPDIKPQTWQEVVFPICWGSPQDCRGEADKKAGQGHPPLYSVTFRVDCIDGDNGRDRGDSTTTFTSSKSTDDAKQKALDAYNSSDMCQIDPNYRDHSRIMKPGSGRFI